MRRYKKPGMWVAGFTLASGPLITLSLGHADSVCLESDRLQAFLIPASAWLPGWLLLLGGPSDWRLTLICRASCRMWLVRD